jgi:hypothetical protein
MVGMQRHYLIQAINAQVYKPSIFIRPIGRMATFHSST